jgi:hypothetical protein
MRFVFLFIFALALGHSYAHADGSGEEWQQLEQEEQGAQDYDEFYMDDDQGGDQTIVQQQQNVTIIDNSVTINNYNFIDVNVFPQAPAILPMPPQPPPVHHCYVVPRPWGWTIYAYLFNGTSVPLANGQTGWQFQQARQGLYFSGQCPNP